MRVGVIGCGTVSEPYLRNLTAAPGLEAVACSDLVIERAEARAAEFGIPRACAQAELLADPGIDLVVNLTIPAAHFRISMEALRAGKHVWSEKPLALDRAEAAGLLAAAGERGLEIGCAPDTVLGAGLQTCRRLIDDGLIGSPLAGDAFFMARGPERWHPDPEFLYQPGAGPLFDVGVYHLAALVAILGPVREVTGLGRVLFPERAIGSGPRAGKTFTVNTDTYVSAVARFASDAIVTLIATFGVWGAGLPKLQVFGSEGVLTLPDPNTFGGPVYANLYGDELGVRELPLLYQHTEAGRNSRGLGVVDMAHAIAEGRRPRASGEIAFHVLDVMQAIAESAGGGGHIDIQSTCERPEPLPLGTVAGRDL